MLAEPQPCALQSIPHAKYGKKPIDNASFFNFLHKLWPNLAQILAQDHTHLTFFTGLQWNMLEEWININNFNCNPVVLKKIDKTSKNYYFGANLLFLWYGVQMTEFFVILDHFCPFTPPPPNNPENQNFGKMKKHLEILYFTYLSSKWHSHAWFLRYGCDRQNFLSFWAIFYPFTPLKPPKNEKYTWRYYHFTQVHQKSWSYAILFLRYSMWWT